MITTSKTFQIVKKGRKYFAATINGHRAELIINAITEHLQPGETVTLNVYDRSDRSDYGTKLRFEAVNEAQLQAEKWLAYAKEDAAQGMYRTNAIAKALELCPAEQTAELRERIAANKTADEARRAARQAQWDAENEARQAARAERVRRRRLFPLADLPREGVVIQHGETYIVYTGTGKSFRIGEDDPSIHGYQLLGHEGDLGCYCYYRDATAEEIAAYKAEQAAKAAARDAQKAQDEEIDAIAEIIRETGEFPDEMQAAVGEKVMDTANIYGGGRWFVIGQEHIWYIQNNGSDGDDWSRNNIRTGGAGAMGWRIPFDQTVADRLQKLAENWVKPASITY